MRRSPRIGQQHRDWIILLDREGPFLSYPVLADVFPQGLDALDTELYRTAKEAYSLWSEKKTSPDVHVEWIRFVLDRVLGYHPALLSAGQSVPSTLNVRAQTGENLRPDIVLHDPQNGAGSGALQAGAPRMLICTYPEVQRLDKAVSGGNRSPIARMQELLLNLNVNRGSGAQLSLGLVSNGRHWALVYAPKGEAGSTAVWDAYAWADERISLQSFIALLGQARLTGVAENDQLEGLFARSAANQQEVTDQLGRQVRRAVEVLVSTLDRIDADRNRTLLAGIEPREVYDAALTMMMRLVFMFSAEENGLLLLGRELYDSNYSVSLLRAQLNDEADRVTEEVLGHRTDAWARLLASFRLVYSGCQHPDLSIPPYGGNLFNPDRYPFLEGRPAGSHWRDTPASPLPVDNRTVLHLLRALQELEIPGRKGEEAQTQLISFKGLDIEQIGHVYEGLLDHTAKRASEPVLGLDGPREPEVALSELEALAAKGRKPLVDFLKERTGRSPGAIEKALDNPVNLFAHKLGTRCAGDMALVARIAPYAALLRQDTLEYPVVILPGAVYVTQGSLRRSTGTHYTPRSLTEPIVKHTLDPLVYSGPAEGLPAEQWVLRSPRELLTLRVCDMAMGSGAFLVQACRYLSERLVESWQIAARTQPKDELLCLPFAEPSLGELGERMYPRGDTPIEAEERSILARRLIAERCLYGVDLNPMAVEMAKLSLWLITMQRDKPFSFLDHAFKCGDSLLGVGADNIRTWSLDGKGRALEGYVIQQEIDLAVDLRRQLEAISGENMDALMRKEHLHKQAEALTARLKLAGDLVLAPYIGIDKPKERVNEANELSSRFIAFTPSRIDTFVHSRADEGLAQEDAELRARATELLGYSNNEGQHKTHRPFHWELEFPEVFLQGDKRGFDAFVGNPPFRGGLMITPDTSLGYTTYLKAGTSGAGATTDLCAYFFRRAYALLTDGGVMGLIAINTIKEGDTRDASLEAILAGGGCIIRAVSSMPWPGTAAASVAIVWIAKSSSYSGCALLDNTAVAGIDSHLSCHSEAVDVYQLHRMSSLAFLGTTVYGEGFFLAEMEATELLSLEAKYETVVKPFLNGDDLINNPSSRPTRFVICFQGFALEQLNEYPAAKQIVLERVFPARQKSKTKKRREAWWLYTSPAEALYRACNGLKRVLVTCFTSKFTSFTFLDVDMIFSNAVIVVASASAGALATLQSDTHLAWVQTTSSTLETRQRYALSDCFETFPFPVSLDSLEAIGERYYQHRQAIMLARQEGLTATYNRFHRPEEQSADIVELRRLHLEMDEAVARAYGWTAEQGQALELGHGFHETKQGLRYTISPAARQEVLDRLLALNITRYAEEVAQGLHNNDKKLTAEKIAELCERLRSLDRPDLIEAVRNRPTGKAAKSAKSSSPRGRKANPAPTKADDGLFQ